MTSCLRRAFVVSLVPRRPLVGYGVLLGTYSALTGMATLAVRRRARRAGPLPTPTVGDLALLSVATFRVSRTWHPGRRGGWWAG